MKLETKWKNQDLGGMQKNHQIGFNDYKQNSGYDFKPSISTLTRILNYVGKQGPSAKTRLSRKTNLNYTRLANHVVWMEKKGYVESVIRESKINIKMTEKGRLFAESISES